ncbi:MAG: protein kinase [Bryobacterales bacterium]|nr:protein kinase [Bryobacterales bacterium]
MYRARDTRLGRTVAVKVLPDHIAQREDARGRFEREARAVASLNHPHICVLHDIGPNYMVLELIEGETLAARIEKGALPLAQALQYAVQIADALDRAHRAGVTHRDVKPQNIMLTRDGVKVLDFGLAKSTAKPAPMQETLTAVLTTEGTVLGTPQYMAPEQFEGKEADARSDIWAFGAVLYEMVTGRKAFQGKSYTSLVAAILGGEPAPMAVKPFTPVWLERLVRRCLAKDPEDRWQSMRDIVLELRSPVVESAAPKPSPWSWRVTAAACLVAVAALGWTGWRRQPRETTQPATFVVEPPAGGRFVSAGISGGSEISPDGRTLAFVAEAAKGPRMLYVRPLESLEARALPGTENAGRPFWSPDSKSLAFFAEQKLKRIDLAGGAPIALCDARNGRGGAWSEDGVILFSERGSAIQRVEASGGTPSPVTKLNRDTAESSHDYPQFLPGGREILYVMSHADPEENAIFIGFLNGKPSVKLVETQYKALYDAASGQLLYIQGNGTLMARRLELNPPRLTGDPVVVAKSIDLNPGGFANFSVAASGTLFYGRGAAAEKVRFTWRDREGKVLGTVGEPFQRNDYSFRISPDQTKVAYTAAAAAGQFDVSLLDLARGLSTRFTFSRAYNPRWSPDGRHVYFWTAGAMFRKAADDSGEEELVLKGDLLFAEDVSPDGKHFLYYHRGDIWKLALAGERKAEPYLRTKYNEVGAAFSPDGRWVAYASDESGRPEVYVQGFPQRQGKWLISGDGGFSPAWRGDGKELYWVGRSRMLTAASMSLEGAAVQPGKPEPLFQLADRVGSARFAPARDGQRFLVLEPEGGEPPDLPMVVVQNWAARLGR